jgi:hypothetical protein
MPRPLTSQEEVQARQVWPRMNVDAVIVTDEATNRYNCLAWTLGITTSWVWPWGGRDATKPEFDSFYGGYGFTPAASGTIAAFGIDPDSMTHASITGPGYGPRWESKAGTWLRIQHGLDEMEGGSLYGDVLGFYRRTGPMPADSQSAIVRLQALRKAQTMNQVVSLAADQLAYVRTRAAEVDRDLKARFEEAYVAWKATWSHPLIAVSSAPGARARSIEYLELIALGPGILPLLMEKLTDPEEFFALVAVDRLARPELRVTHDPGDGAVLLGEQGRAIETVQRWVKAGS